MTKDPYEFIYPVEVDYFGLFTELLVLTKQGKWPQFIQQLVR